PLFGRHLDSRPLGLGGKVFYLLCLSSILSNSSVMQLLYTKTMRTYLWLLPRPNWESIGPHCINGKRNSAPARRHAWLRLKPRQKLYLMQNAYVHWKKKTPNCVKSEIFCVRLRSILPKRHAGDPLPVCRRPPHRILGQADV